MTNKSKVNIFDPNTVNTAGFFNSNINIENLTLYVELIAKRKGSGSSITITNSVVTKVNTDNDKFDINLLGLNSEKKAFTTDWTNNTPNNTQTQYEGFGINDIKIKTNSSLLPQVTIEFIDIHGLSAFNNNESSPYRVLFDFPPPIFTLIIKGYYGKPLSYDLHLIKNEVRFNPETGNYYITSEFVARTFAPLSDVLFKYAEIFPLLIKGNEVSLDQNTTPKTTHELLLRIKNLYDNVAKISTTSSYNRVAKETATVLTNFKNYIDIIKNYKFNFTDDIVNDVISCSYDRNSEDGSVLTEITYDQYIKYIAQLGITTLTDTELRFFICIKDTTNSDKRTKKIEELTAYAEKLLNDAKQSLTTISVNDDFELKKTNDISGIYGVDDNKTYTLNNENYICIDLTIILQKINKEYNLKLQTYSQNSEDFKKEIDDLPNKILSFEPTIYNIFKILCDDIDTFFSILKTTCDNAVTHHRKYKSQIINSNSVLAKTTEISAFPLVFNEDKNGAVSSRKSKIIPITLSRSLDEEFPEVKLVEDFLEKYVDVLKERKVLNLKSQLNENNVNIWIPISPIDSELYQQTTSLESPYASFLYQLTGENSIVDNIYNILLDRYYIISQYVFQNRFSDITNLPTNEFIINYMAEAEAANIAISLINKDVLFMLRTQSKQGVTSFIQRLKNLKKNTYNELSDNTNIILNGDIPIYVNKNDENFIGSSFVEAVLIVEKVIKTNNKVSNDYQKTEFSDPVSNFINKNNDSIKWYKRFFKNVNQSSRVKKVTKENLIYYPDNEKNENEDISTYNIRYNGKDSIYSNISKEFNGNSVNTWEKIIEYYGEVLLEIINNNDYNNTAGKQAKAILFLSMFSRTLSPYENTSLSDSYIIGNDPRGILANLQMPGIQIIPASFALYLGGLLSIDNFNSDVYNIILSIKEDINNFEDDSELDSILSDLLFSDKILIKIVQNITSLNDYLCPSDKEMYTTLFNEFVVQEITTQYIGKYTYSMFEESLTEILNDYIEGINEDNDVNLNKLLTGSDMIDITNFKIGLMINTTLAYEPTNSDTIQSTYQTLSQREGILGVIDQQFFTQFLSKLDKYLSDRIKYIGDLEQEYLGGVDNDDIKTRVYYSFKNIADKWLLDEKQKGYPSLPDDKPTLIENFLFVDRAMNDIGGGINTKGSILDIEQLIDLSNDFDMNMLSTFSSILSHNNFEFFPIQNFLEFDKNEWENNSFRIHSNTKLDVNASPQFVCMYVGGAANILAENEFFYDDGISDLESFGNDFIGDSSSDKINSVNAFKVAYATQNQSIFIGVDLDSKEFSETNESLQILSKLAGDESSASPTPIAQNLFPMYQNRAYSSTVTMLGNAMIQPTQYYQIENIPMFNGAYVILDVEHSIRANYMTTKFRGVKIGQYPNPIVSDFSTSIGVNTGTSDFLSESNENIRVDNIGNSGAPQQANYASMHEFLIA
jgi:hypothetical protein